jgi:predicted Zn-ribbon and HTH transcriptional regulator
MSDVIDALYRLDEDRGYRLTQIGVCRECQFMGEHPDDFLDGCPSCKGENITGPIERETLEESAWENEE